MNLSFLGLFSISVFLIFFMSDEIWAEEEILVNWTDKNTISDGCCGHFSVSDDGKYVYFVSHGKEITSDDQYGTRNIFLRDVIAKKTFLISQSQTDKPSYDEASLNSYEMISGDGRYLGFTSKGQFISEDTNSQHEAYVYDRQTGKLKRLPVNIANDLYIQGILGITPNGKSAIVSFKHDKGYSAVYDLVSEKITSKINAGGLGAMEISGNSRHIVFYSDTIDNLNTKRSIYSYDIQTNNLELVSILEGYSVKTTNNPTISHDGRFVAFSATVNEFDNSGRYKNEITKMFFHDSETKKTEILNIPQVDGQENPLFISEDGRFVAFSAYSERLTCCQYFKTGIFILDRETKNVELIVEGIIGDFSSNGEYLGVITSKPLLSGDENNDSDLYLIKNPFELYFEKVKIPKDANSFKEVRLHGSFAVNDDCTGAMQINGKNEFSEIDNYVDISVFYPDKRELGTFQTNLDNQLQFIEKIPLSNDMPEGNYKIQMTQQNSIYEQEFYFNGRTQTHEQFISCKANTEIDSIKESVLNLIPDSGENQKSLEKYLNTMLTKQEYDQYHQFIILNENDRPSSQEIIKNLTELRTVINEKIKSDVEDAFYVNEKQINQNYDIDDAVDIILEIRTQKDQIIREEQNQIHNFINNKISFENKLERQKQRDQENEQESQEKEQEIIGQEQKLAEEKQKLKDELIEKFGDDGKKAWNYGDTHIDGFPDSSNSPDYYLKRYNDEIKYKEWFDNNFPDQTIQKILGIDEISIISETVVPESEIITESNMPRCGTGTELVNGVCLVIQEKSTSSEVIVDPESVVEEKQVVKKQPKKESNFLDGLMKMFASWFE